MKRLILTADIAPRETTGETFNRFATLLNETYARLHKIDYEYVQYKNDIIDGRHYSWARIPLLMKYASHFDEILWLEPSVFIVDRNVDVFENLKTAPEAKWERDPTVKPVLYTVVDRPTNDSHACSAIYLIDCTNKEKLKDCLNDWWNDLTDNRFSITAPFQQVVWNYIWKNDSKKRNYLRVADSITMFETKNQFFRNVLPALGSIRMNIVKKYIYKLLNFKKSCCKRIGIFMRYQDIFTNGCGQNCIFLKHALEATGHDVDLIVFKLPTGASGFVDSEVKYMYVEFPTINLNDYCLFISGSGIPVDEVEKIKKAGVRHVVYTPANIFDAFHVDAFLDTGNLKMTFPFLESKFHTLGEECWLPETHVTPTSEYLRILNRNRLTVKTIPHLWSPLFTLTNGELPIYKPRTNKQLDIVIIEANSSYVKCGLGPLMIAEKLHLDHPDLINKVYFFNLPKNNNAQGMVKSLKLSEDGLLRIMPRLKISEILTFFANPAKNGGNKVAFIMHQTYVPHNYAYYDVLASGFPLIHNSLPLEKAGIGYFYTDFESGAEAVLQSVKSFDYETYHKKALDYLDCYHPYNPAVISKIKDRLCCTQEQFEPSINETLIVKTERSFWERLQVLVINGDGKRKDFILKMFENLRIRFAYDFFEAYTPKNSADYINFRTFTNVEPERDELLCCSRSHIAAIHTFVNDPRYKSKDILMIVEDDVTFVKEGFEQELEKAFTLLEAHASDIDFLNIGYLSMDIKTKYSDKNLRWGLENNLWGAQAYLIKRNIATEMAPILYKPTSLDLYKSICQTLEVKNKGVRYAKKTVQLTPDSFLSILWRQSFVYPPLAIEYQYFKSKISDLTNEEKFVANYKILGELRPSFYNPEENKDAPRLEIIE